MYISTINKTLVLDWYYFNTCIIQHFVMVNIKKLKKNNKWRTFLNNLKIQTASSLQNAAAYLHSANEAYFE